MNDPEGGVAKVTCPTFEAMGQIPAFHRTCFLYSIRCVMWSPNLTNKIAFINKKKQFVNNSYYRLQQSKQLGVIYCTYVTVMYR